MFRFAVIISCILSSSCATQMVRSAYGDYSKYGPVESDVPNTGEVKYVVNDLEYKVKFNREQAYKAMYDECLGRYKILKEWDSDGGSTGTFVYGVYTSTKTVYRHIEFVCLD